MVIQGIFFALAYRRFFAGAPMLVGGMKFAAAASLFSWTFTTLAVAAKHPMTSITDFVIIETGFTLVQFAVVGPLMALAWKGTAIVGGKSVRRPHVLRCRR
jgi:hypothetical protein